MINDEYIFINDLRGYLYKELEKKLPSELERLYLLIFFFMFLCNFYNKLTWNKLKSNNIVI